MRGRIPFDIHGALETLYAPAIMVAPFALGFGEVATAICIGLGALLLGIAISSVGGNRGIPVAAHASLDYIVAAGAIAAAIAVGLATEDVAATAFLAGVGVVQMALTAFTRFSVPRGA